MESNFYDEIARIYDTMIRWERRLAIETPLFEALWRRRAAGGAGGGGPLRVLDASCGSGAHLALFARQGLAVTGSDASEAMLELARERVAALPQAPIMAPRLVLSRWSELNSRIAERFDVVLCLGNSLPYVTDPAALESSLRGLWAKVTPGGLLLIQWKNFARMQARGERYLPVSGRIDEATGLEHVAVRQYEWKSEGKIANFNVIVLTRRRGESDWHLRHWSTPLAAWTGEQVATPLAALGARVTLHGSLALEPFDPAASEDVVAAAERPS